jgi:hypothetical protein
MARTPEPLVRESLLKALEALEAAVFVDYAMRSEPLPRTAAALRQARDVIHRARIEANPGSIRKHDPRPSVLS